MPTRPSLVQPDSNPDETIFAAALQWETAESRVAYLDEACAGDPVLRRRVEELILASEAAKTFLERPVARNRKATREATNQTTVAEESETAGSRIGRYKLLQQIGEGGCGTVFMAEQEVPVRRRVALKVIKLGMDTKSVIARFEAERQALALMDHPNIARVLDAGATESGRPYFVMELVRGIRITDYCEQNHLTTRQRLDLFIKVCQAIQHAHQKGIIHRDIKPSNILVTLHDGVPVPKVIDFGIAKATEGRLTDATLFTAFEQFIGTPAYMSPEQAEMSGLDVDTRSDIYSLGVLLYELLAGKTPFDARELMSLGVDAMRKTIREQEPAKPSTKLSQTLLSVEVAKRGARGGAESNRSALTRQRLRELRGDLDWIVMRCLEKDRTRRYETSNAIALDIARHLANEPVVARPPSAAYRIRKAFRRNRLVYLAGCVVFLALTAGVAASLWQTIRANRSASRARDAEALAERRLGESEAVSKFLVEVFQSPDPARDGRTIKVAETLDAATRKLGDDLPLQPLLQAQLQMVLAKTYNGLGLYSEAIHLERLVHNHYLASQGPTHTNTLNAAVRLGVLLAGNGVEHRQEAEQLMHAAVADFRRIFGSDHPATLRAMSDTIEGLVGIGVREETLALEREVLERQKRVLGPEHSDTIKTMTQLSATLVLFGDMEEAVVLSREALRLRRKISGPRSLDTLEAMRTHALCLAEANRGDEALRLEEEILPIARQVLGPEHTHTLSIMANMTADYLDQKRNEEAFRLAKETHEIAVRVRGVESGVAIVSLGNLATAYARLGHPDEAIRLGEQVLALRRKLTGPTSPGTLESMTEMARIYTDTGRIEEAITLAETALKTERSQLPSIGHELIGTLRLLIELYQKVGRGPEREALVQELEHAVATLAGGNRARGSLPLLGPSNHP